jgi:N-acyl-D-amino-acid deacylase
MSQDNLIAASWCTSSEANLRGGSRPKGGVPESGVLVMQQPWVGFGSDGAVLNLQGSDFAHPRSFASNVRILGYYVRDQHVLTLENAVRKMTSLPAQIMGIPDRGQIHEGFAADVVLFDPDQVGETNSYEKPNSYAKGVPYVLVNGVLVIDKGMHTGARPGKIVYGPGYKREQLKSEAARHQYQ